uniref:Bm11053, isoform a n=1 Tax=Brugia malayi TaxID=6279 RepID=A0A1I9G592_BRUMA|nr:Bm11053, isoform a [Brugia malayi]
MDESDNAKLNKVDESDNAKLNKVDESDNTDNTTTPLLYKSPSEKEMNKQNEQFTKTVISEVTVNIGGAQDYRCLSVRKSEIGSAKIIMEGQGDVTSKRKKSNEQENLNQMMGESWIQTRWVRLGESNSRKVIPVRGVKTDERKDSSGEVRETSDANHSIPETESKKTLQANEDMECDIEGEKDDERCETEELEPKNPTEEKEMEMKFGPDLVETKECVTDNSFKKRKDKKGKKSSSATRTKRLIPNEKYWKASYEQERKIEEFHNELIIRRDHYQKQLEETRNEKERLNIELLKVDEKISTLEKATKKLENENAKYLSIIQDMRNNSERQLEEQTNELRHSVKLRQMAKEQLQRSNETRAAQLELVIKQKCEDNLKLHALLENIEEKFRGRKTQAIRSEEFHQRFQKKLNDLLQKFRAEAVNTDLTWLGEENIQYAVDLFETTIRTILQDEPCFHHLVERVALFMDIGTRQDNMQLQLPKNDSESETAKSHQSQDLATFKKKFRKEIRSMLKEYMEKQKNELSRNISTIINHLEGVEKKIDAVLTKRVENMKAMITLMDNKQNDLRKIEEELDHSTALVKSISDERKIRPERKENLWKLNKENCKLKEDCSSLKSGYMVLFCNHSRS